MRIEKVRLTKRFTFEAAHALYNYHGACRNIHGHSYVLEVTIIGEARQEPGHPKDGMLMDFGDLKKIVQEQVINEFDHALILNTPQAAIAEKLRKEFPKVILLAFQPSCENLIIEIKNRLREMLDGRRRIHSIKLRETESSWVEWNSYDN